MVIGADQLTDACSEKYSLAFNLYLTSSILTFVISTISNNVSQVDKLWSILPIIYAIIFTSSNNKKTWIMATLVLIWGIRLTYNFYRRGGYTFPKVWLGEEDYRWSYIRKGFFHPMLSSKNHITWMIFNLIFISFYQNLLLLLMTSPSLVVCCHSNKDNITVLDFVAIFLFLMFIAIETKADQEQWEFQIEKHRRMEISNTSNATNTRQDFCQTGLFSIVRKPNYAAEQGLWVSYYLLSISSSKVINISIIGCVLLLLLFQGSGWFTEKITMMKYPKYAEYKKQVPLYVPSNISSIVAYFNTCSK